MRENQIITFLSDFGTSDGYVGSVKGVIKSLSPNTEIIDITHEIEPFNITAGAFTLLNYYQNFPKDTIHLVIVDPGVGGERRLLIVRTAHYYFVGPDNGVFQYIISREAYSAYEINLSLLPDTAKSHTFHARDVFAPAAAKLAQGIPPQKFSSRIDNFTESFKAMITKVGAELELDCISIDRFGNIITNFSKQDLSRLKKNRIISIRLKKFETKMLNKYYTEKNVGEILALWNSQDFLEIAVCKGSAAKRFSFKPIRDKIYIRLE